jgi:light-dependent protochlorophyllide reductase
VIHENALWPQLFQFLSCCSKVIGAVRDLDKMMAVAEIDGYGPDEEASFTPMYCELNSFESVKSFVKELNEFRISKPVSRLVLNAGVYQPTLPYAKYSVDSHEQTMQINFLSHFLMVSELMNCNALQDAVSKGEGCRVIMVGSVTGNDNTVGGGGVYPIADLHDLAGFARGFKKPICMADGYGFIGAKAYKDSKLCLMMMANFLHTKYHKLTGISFSSMYPGCIAESPLFREKRPWFRKYFPVFMKFITGTHNTLVFGSDLSSCQTSHSLPRTCLSQVDLSVSMRRDNVCSKSSTILDVQSPACIGAGTAGPERDAVWRPWKRVDKYQVVVALVEGGIPFLKTIKARRCSMSKLS